MRALTDSTAHRDDPHHLRERIARDGYFLIRGLVAAPAVEEAADAIRAVARERSWTAADSDVAASSAPVKGSPEYYDMTTRLQRLEAVHRLAFEPGLQSFMAALIGERSYVHPCKAVRVQWPTRLGGTPVLPHRDFTEIQCVEDCFVTWIPLTACPARKGGLRLFPDSQEDRVLDDPPAREPVSGDLAAGDALVFHSLLRHQGSPNETDELRISVDFRWQSAYDPRQADAMLPHRFPDIPGWPELTAGWRSTRWIEAPDARVLARVPDAELRPCASRFVRVGGAPTSGPRVTVDA